MNNLLLEIEKWINKNKDEILDTISGLVKINTVNLGPDGYEKPGQEFLF